MSGNKDIFNLIENPNDLPSSNQGMAEMFYREILPTRNVSDSASASAYSTQFGGTNISIRWNLDNRTWWIPARSYIKLDLEITKPGDGSELLTLEDKIAPNMGIAASLFNRLAFKMNDTTVSQISQYIPQCDALTKRIYQSENWLDKQEGDAIEHWNAYQKKRVHDLSNNGFVSDYYVKDYVEQVDAVIEELNKEELGFGPVVAGNGTATTAFDINANQIMTLTAILGFQVPNANDVFKAGDEIIFNDGGNNTRFFWVKKVIDATHVNLLSSSGFVQDVIGANNEGGTSVIRRRMTNRTIEMLTTEKVITQEVVTGTYFDANSITVQNGFFQDHIQVHDLMIFPFTVGGTNYQGLPIKYKAVENSGFGLSAGRDNGADADLLVGTKYELWRFSEIYDFKDMVDLGFGQVTVNGANYQRISLSVAGVLEVQQNGGPALPALGTIFQRGDLVIVARAGGVFYHYYWVDSIISATQMRVYQSAAHEAIAAANFNYIAGRLRYSTKAVSVDGNINQAKKKAKFDVCWKPSCLSIFNYQGALPGGTKFELELQALAQEYIGLAIETPPGIQKSGRVSASIIDKDYQVLVKNLKFYICQVQGPVVGDEEYSYYINMNECRAHTRKLQSKSLVQTSLDVTPSSYALALAFQDNRAINREDTDKSVTKFHVAGTNSDKEELAITRYSIRFAGLSVPQPDAELKEGDAHEFLCNQYIRNQMYTGQYFKQSGGESMEEWKERGIYFYHPFVRSAGNREVRAYVLTQFNDTNIDQVQLSDEALDNLQLYLFEFYRAFALIKMRNGFVYNIQTATQ